MRIYVCVCIVVIYIVKIIFRMCLQFVGKDNIEILILKEVLVITHISMKELHGEIIVYVGFDRGWKEKIKDILLFFSAF